MITENLIKERLIESRKMEKKFRNLMNTKVPSSEFYDNYVDEINHYMQEILIL